MTQIGERVGAIICSDPKAKTVTLAGYGTYEGEIIPEPGQVIFMGMDIGKLKRANPKILLDNGQTIWGGQCWWGSESQIQTAIKKYIDAGYTVIGSV